MVKNLLLKCIHSKECNRILALAPILLALGLFSLYSAIKNPLPEKSELIPFIGVITNLENSSGLVLFENKQERLRFKCMCDYGWGYKSFDNPNSINALVNRNSNADLYAWQLSINDKPIFTYEEVYLDKKQNREQHIQFSVYLIIGTIAGLMLYGMVYFLRRKFPKFEQKRGSGGIF